MLETGAAVATTNPWLLPLLIGGTTAMKLIGDENERVRSQKLKAAEIRASPWTGLAPTTQVKSSNPWSTLAQGGTAAGMAYAGGQQQAADNQFRSDVLEATKAGQASAVPVAGAAPFIGENPVGLRTDIPDYLRNQSPWASLNSGR